jgi:hypothetical protein
MGGAGAPSHLFMPFGLANAAQTFQRLMDSLFRSFPTTTTSKNVYSGFRIKIYIDDCTVYTLFGIKMIGW